MRDYSPHASPQIGSPNYISVSAYETGSYRRGIIQVKKGPIFAFRWYGIDSFGIVKKLLCCIQVRQKKRDKIARNQIAEGKDEAIDSKEGKGEAECVDIMHPQNRITTAK